MKVVKRDGTIVDFDEERIRIAIGKLRSRFAQKRNADSELVEYYKENRGNEKDSGWYEIYGTKKSYSLVLTQSAFF